MDKGIWKRLKDLRQSYLTADGFLADYWQDEALLDAYDRSLGQRIQWKWDAVLDLFPARHVKRLVDWGCGSGGATRSVLRHWTAEEAVLLDRSAKARSFAAKKVTSEHPSVKVATQFDGGKEPYFLLISHVLSELPEKDVDALTSLVRNAEGVLWVEAGRTQESRKLSAIRERIRDVHHVIGPCPHQNICGMLHPEQKDNWCHFSAKVPTEAYTSAYWRECSKELGFDLRSLPLSYLYTEKSKGIADDKDDVRILAGSRQFKGYTRYFACTRAGVVQADFMKRTNKKLYEELAHPGLGLLLPSSELQKKDDPDHV